MRNYSSLKKQNKSALSVLAILSLCVLLSAVMLFGRLSAYTPGNACLNIPLTRSNGVTRVISSAPARSALPRTALAVRMPSFFLAAPGFSAYDEDTVWSGKTDVEIFSLTYDNETGETTVRSQNGMKVLAPGTGSIYRFALENTGNVSLDYTLEMEAFFSHSEYPIPVYARFSRSGGEYLLGSDTETVDVLRLSEVKESGVISAGYVQPYELYWEWPFELDDEYDTMLGNMAVEEDISLTIIIRTTAQYNADPDAPGGDPPYTGDTRQISLYAAVMVASLAGILAILLLREKENEYEAN